DPWWQVDLGQQAEIQQVNIFNRTSCCLDRLKEFYVFVSDLPFSNSASLTTLVNDPQVSHTFFSGQAGASENISLTASGRYVRIQLSASNGPLHIAEVQIMGCPANSSDPCSGTPSISIDPAGPFLTDQGVQQLSATPSVGTWSEAAANNGTFDPSQGAGTYTVSYTVDFGNGCLKSENINITVNEPGDPCSGTAAVSINAAGPFLSNQGVQQLFATPSGGTWSGAATTDGTFDPSQGAGTYTVSYTVDFGNGCIKFDDLSITVEDPPTGGECSTPTNLALNQSASQSSTYGDGVASIAVDGNTDGNGSPWGANAALTHTQSQANPWWQVDLGQQADIQQVNIFNRTSCCLDRLNDFYVFVSDQPFSNSASVSGLLNDPQVDHTFFSGQAGASENISLTAFGRYVRIQLSASNGPLHIAEVQVMGCPTNSSAPCSGTPSVSINPAGPFQTNQSVQQLSATPSGGTWSGAAATSGTFDPSQGAGTYTVSYIVDFGNGCTKSENISIIVEDPPTGGECTTPSNLALNQSTSQSSTYGDGVASIAVDGNTDGNGSPWGASASLTHTQSEANPWWQVDLGQQADIEQVNVFNRTGCCLDRLKDFYVFVSEQPFSNSASVSSLVNDPQVSNTFFAGQAGASENISLNATGRYVRIQLSASNGPLHIAEVQIMGCPTEASTLRLVEEYIPSEIPKAIESQMLLRPNPTTQQNGLEVFLQIPEGENLQLGIYSIDGKKVYAISKQVDQSEIRLHIPLENLSSGMYIIRAMGNSYSLKKRFIVK
ncbi:MAG: discoidin domain-containing protein, partial [Bacteroidota bacterium]